MTARNSRTTRSFPPSGRRRWLRPGAWFGLAALCLNLLAPLAVLAEAAPADPGIFICHATPAGQSADASHPAGAHHCPLCLVLSGGAVAPPGVAPVAALPPLPIYAQPHHAAPTLPPAPVRLTQPQQPRAPPAA